MLKNIRRFLIGQPLESSRLDQEKYTNFKGLAILSSDALSSVAYAGEEVLRILIPVIGLAAFNFISPITIAIILLIFIVSFSYRTIIDSYPNSSGGAYIVSKDNLGIYPGLIAGASLLFDYVLTVAVSVSAGVAAITSAFHQLIPYTVPLILVIITFLLIMNLRGISESANLFSYPTYFFVLGMIVLIVVGIAKVFIYGVPAKPVNLPVDKSMTISAGVLAFAVLKAFSSGCSAMTGIEAVSNAVPAFKAPESQNAKKVLLSLSIVLFLMFGGLALLTKLFWIAPTETDTVISLVAEKVFGRNIIYFLFQASTAMILMLAANTSFAGFPMLASLIASDGYAPRYLALRGDRLAFSNGILALGIMAGILVTIFKGNVTSLIPLYAVGVFTSFTLAQTGMVKRWFKNRTGKWKSKAIINGVGAITTGAVTLTIGVTKFMIGAWVVIILVPIMVLIFKAVHKHYMDVKTELDFDNYKPPSSNVKHTIMVPVASLSNVVANTIDYAKTLGPDIKAVHISSDKVATEKLVNKWNKWNPGVELTVVESPYRAVIDPLIDFINELEKHKAENEIITVLLPEFVTRRWWHRFLHNQTGLMLQNMLVAQKDIVVTAVPFHLKQ